MRDFEEQGEAWMMMTGGFWSVALNSLQNSSPISWNLWPFFWRMKTVSERSAAFELWAGPAATFVAWWLGKRFSLLGLSAEVDPTFGHFGASTFFCGHFFDEKLLRRWKQISICEDVSDIFRMLFWVHGHSTFWMHLIKLLNLLPPKKHQQQNCGRAAYLFSLFKDLAAKYAAVASKSMVESSFSSNKQDSIDSMVPEPFSNGSTSGP